MTELDKFLKYRCLKGLQERGFANNSEYQERLQYELDVIASMGFSGYFLIVQDFVVWAKNNNILVGCARGSAGGCLLSYCLRITELDPIKYDLLFERFMNPDRISMPDIDIDFPNRKRHLVLEYICQKYGEGNVAHIGTFGTLKSKSAVKDVARTLGEPIPLAEKICKLLLAPISGKPQPIAESIKQVPKIKAMAESDSAEGTVIRWAQKVEGLKKSQSTHACGIVIGNESLMDSVPLCKGRAGEVVTQWEMGNIEDIGLIKFDNLGVDALDKIEICLELIKERYDRTIDVDNLPLDDELVFSELRQGNTMGIFQMEGSAGIRDLLVKVKPSSIEDIIATTCLFRPGPLSSGYADIYVDVKNGTREPEYIVPELEPILGNTHSVFIYQEQIMNIAKKLCGYTGGQADELRKAIGKKKQKLMDKHEKLFKDGWVKNGYPAAGANKLWDDINNCASYLFNRSHGAGYSIISYQTAYLKVHYPTEYLCAVMLVLGGKKKDHLIKCLTECKRLGIQVLPPDINESKKSFSVTNDKQIRFGLGPIKNVGAGANTVLEERRIGGPFSSLRNFCERVDMSTINRLKLESLIKAGCFDRFGQNRATMLAAVEGIWEYRDEIKRYESKVETYKRKEKLREDRLREIEEGLTNKKPLKPWPIPEEPRWPEVVEMDELNDTETHSMEHDLLGFFVSSHPLDNIDIKGLSTIEEMEDMGNGQEVVFAGVVTSLKEITTKVKKKKMGFALVEDLTGSLEVTIFSTVYSRISHLLESTSPIQIRGNVDVTEADEGDKTTKVRVKDVTLLDFRRKTDEPEILDVCVPITRAAELVQLLDKYAGDQHEVRVATTLQDGTKIRYPIQPFIGKHRGVFMKEVARISDGTKER